MADDAVPTAGRITVVVADDHPVVLEGLVSLLSMQPDIDIVATCVNGEEALAAIRRHQPDVLVLDMTMPVMSGLDVLRELHNGNAATRVALLTGEIDADTMIEVLSYGVRGVLLKEMAAKMIVQCVRKIHHGGEWLERETVGDALKTMVSRNQQRADLEQKLTSRELQIALQVAKGMRNGQIAERLSISEGTVKTHLHNVYEKLSLGGRVELVNYLRRRDVD